MWVGEEVAEHRKHTQKGVFSMFGMRGVVGELMWGSRTWCAGGWVGVSASRRGDMGVWLVKMKKKEEFQVYLVCPPPSMRLTRRVPLYRRICDVEWVLQERSVGGVQTREGM